VEERPAMSAREVILSASRPIPPTAKGGAVGVSH
jgi:hypothetical protein